MFVKLAVRGTAILLMRRGFYCHLIMTQDLTHRNSNSGCLREYAILKWNIESNFN